MLRDKTLFFEYKRLFSNRIWVVIALCFAISLVFWSYRYKDLEEDLIYKEVVEQYRGNATDEKREDISYKMEYYTRIINEHFTISEKYAKDEISTAEYKEIIADYNYAKANWKGWEKLWENTNRYTQQKNSADYLYEVSWEKLLDNDLQWAFTFLMIILLIPYFYLDRETGFYAMGESFWKYKYQKKNRLCFALVIILLLQVLWIASEHAVVIFQSSIPDPNAAACSLKMLTQIKSGISLGQVYLVKNLLLLLKRCLDVVLLFFAAEKVRGKMLTTVIGLLYLLATNYYYMDWVYRIL